jgi:hypothetical protein
MGEPAVLAQQEILRSSSSNSSSSSSKATGPSLYGPTKAQKRRFARLTVSEEQFCDRVEKGTFFSLTWLPPPLLSFIFCSLFIYQGQGDIARVLLSPLDLCNTPTTRKNLQRAQSKN